MPAVDSTEATFASDVLASEKPVLVDFWGQWCAPCKAIAPALSQLADEQQDHLKVVKVKTEAHPRLAAQYGVTSLPTFLVFKGGKLVGKQVGTAGGIHGIKKLVAPHLGR